MPGRYFIWIQVNYQRLNGIRYTFGVSLGLISIQTYVELFTEFRRKLQELNVPFMELFLRIPDLAGLGSFNRLLFPKNYGKITDIGWIYRITCSHPYTGMAFVLCLAAKTSEYCHFKCDCVTSSLWLQLYTTHTSRFSLLSSPAFEGIWDSYDFKIPTFFTLILVSPSICRIISLAFGVGF